MATALVEALYLKLFEIQCFPAFSISSYWYYCFTIQHLFGVTVSIKKEASSLFTHYWLPILLIFFIYFAASQTSFHFKHNLCFPASLLHTTWFQHIPVARIIREIAYWSANLKLFVQCSRYNCYYVLIRVQTHIRGTPSVLQYQHMWFQLYPHT